MSIFGKTITKTHFSKSLVELAASRLLMRTGFELTLVFLPIFFFIEMGRSFEYVALIYIFIYGFHALLTPLTAKLLKYFSMKMHILIAIPFAFFGMLSLAFWEKDPKLALISYITLVVIYKAFYWVPFHVNFAEFSEKGSRGRQLALLGNIAQIIAIISPIVGGFLITQFGFSPTFIIAGISYFIAIIPIFFLPQIYETYSYGFFETFKKLFEKNNRALFFGYVGEGAQMAVSSVVWPIFIFLLLDEEYTAVGVVTALTILGIVILRSVVGELLDRWDQKRVLTISSLILMTGWGIKIFVETAFQVFIVDTYHRFGRAISRLSVDTATYDQSADNDSYIDEFTVLKEVSLGVGRVSMLLLVIFVFTATSIKFAFLAAALASLLVTLLNKTEKITS